MAQWPVSQRARVLRTAAEEGAAGEGTSVVREGLRNDSVFDEISKNLASLISYMAIDKESYNLTMQRFPKFLMMRDITRTFNRINPLNVLERKLSHQHFHDQQQGIATAIFGDERTGNEALRRQLMKYHGQRRMISDRSFSVVPPNMEELGKDHVNFMYEVTNPMPERLKALWPLALAVRYITTFTPIDENDRDRVLSMRLTNVVGDVDLVGFPNLVTLIIEHTGGFPNVKALPASLKTFVCMDASEKYRYVNYDVLNMLNVANLLKDHKSVEFISGLRGNRGELRLSCPCLSTLFTPSNFSIVHLTDCSVLTDLYKGDSRQQIVNKIFLPASLQVLHPYALDAVKEVHFDQCKKLRCIDDFACLYCTTAHNLDKCTALETVGKTAFGFCKFFRTDVVKTPTESVQQFGLLKLGPKLRQVGEQAFRNCSIVALDDCEKLQVVKRRAFMMAFDVTGLGECSNLSEVHEEAFGRCISPVYLYSEHLLRIGDKAFYSTPSVNLSNASRLQEIGNSAFYTARSVRGLENCVALVKLSTQALANYDDDLFLELPKIEILEAGVAPLVRNLLIKNLKKGVTDGVLREAFPKATVKRV